VTPDEIRAAMDDPVAQRLLDSANPARLAYVARDGTPRVAPVGFLWNGSTVVIGTVPGSAKVAALQANPAVALTIDTSSPAWPPNVLLVRGTAAVTMVDGVFPEYVEVLAEGDPGRGVLGMGGRRALALRPDGAHRRHADLGEGPGLRDPAALGCRRGGQGEVRLTSYR
jgi:Pyridoxamine 5'-phosphate oxidase